jgi:hypothetical protein
VGTDPYSACEILSVWPYANQITINNWFAKAKGNYTIEWIDFANGTRWSGDELTLEYTNGGA